MSKELKIDQGTSRRLHSIGCTSTLGGGLWWRGMAGEGESLGDIHDRFVWAAHDIADGLGLKGNDARRAVGWMTSNSSVKAKTGYMSMDVLGPNGERVCREMIDGQ